MAKRGTKKVTTKSPKSSVSEKTVKLLIENNIALQKVLTMLAAELNGLTKRLDKFMGLVERASEKYIETPISPPSLEPEPKTEIQMPSDKTELINKLETLLQQNKTIARGLILLEKYVQKKLKPTKTTRTTSTTSKKTKRAGTKIKPLPEIKF